MSAAKEKAQEKATGDCQHCWWGHWKVAQREEDIEQN